MPPKRTRASSLFLELLINMILDATIKELTEGLAKKKYSSEEIMKEAYAQAQKTQELCNAFITLLPQKEIKYAPHGPLGGIPFVMKDSYLTSGIKTSAGSAVLGNYVAQYDATVYKKLLDAGAILLGKMNMDAWGHGASTENTDFGPAKNPWDITRVAGGSTGGPAVAIATRATAFAIGEDTGGSIRNPSAWCNITGLKVTYGRVSRYGCIAYASSFDTVGPMGKTAEDCAIVLETIAGIDPYDATSSSERVPKYSEGLKQPIKGLTLGWPEELITSDLDPEIAQTVEEAKKELGSLGMKVQKISLPLLKYGVPLYYILVPSETSSNLARYDGVRYGGSRELFTQETMRRIMIGTYALSAGYYDAYYKRAQQVRTLFIKQYNEALSQCDAIIMPVNPTLPPKIGELMSDPIKNMLADYFTGTINTSGLPSLSLPCGFSKTNLPIGMQLVGKMFSEDLLLRLGHQYQQITDWHTRKPKL